MGVITVVSDFYGFEDSLHTWADSHIVASIAGLLAFAIFAHLVWDVKEEHLKKAYDDKIDDVFEFVKHTKTNNKANKSSKRSQNNPKRKP